MAQAALKPEANERHPRLTADLIGHGAAEDLLLGAYNSGRVPHAWLITGPRGVGKATLAYRFARFLLENGQPDDAGGLFGAPVPANLAVSPESHTGRLLAQGGHPGLTVVTRAWDDKAKRLRGEIVVDDVRKLHGFFGMTADASWRIAIIDSADEMNRQSANALLKMLEEPPKRAVLILLAHAPGRLLPTIRSRCQTLPLRPLTADQVAAVLEGQGVLLPPADRDLIIALSAGSAGRAMALAQSGGAELYRKAAALLADLPRMNPSALHALGDAVAGRQAIDDFRLLGELLDGILKRLITYAATRGAENGFVPGEAEIFAGVAGRAGLDQWLEVWENTGHLFARGEAVNLDPKQVTLTIFSRLQAITA
ncbi:DNA polymerase III subunit delta' [Emcibacter sp. SYSU 3D8]|uniref:DNA polymerase III subunit delta' n=1 Tax=Emcibacter sp. SYSU 3D8 TaxID=3133969 RepID=UPI0031FE67FC